jgi:hypothetical protein
VAVLKTGVVVYQNNKSNNNIKWNIQFLLDENGKQYIIYVPEGQKYEAPIGHTLQGRTKAYGLFGDYGPCHGSPHVPVGGTFVIPYFDEAQAEYDKGISPNVGDNKLSSSKKYFDLKGYKSRYPVTETHDHVFSIQVRIGKKDRSLKGYRCLYCGAISRFKSK